MRYLPWYFWDLLDCIKEVRQNDVILYSGWVKFLSAFKSVKIPIESLGHYEEHHSQQYYIREGWKVPRLDFVAIFLRFQQEIIAHHLKWNDLPDIMKLVEILREIFRRNLSGHNSSTMPARWHAFDKKNRLLTEAVFYATDLEKTIPFFSWGKQEDSSYSRFPIILYFQIENMQVSFHAPRSLGEGVPLFPDHWNGIRQQAFPMSLASIRKVFKDHSISTRELRRTVYCQVQPYIIRTELERSLEFMEENNHAKEKQLQNNDQLPVIEISRVPIKPPKQGGKSKIESLDVWLGERN